MHTWRRATQIRLKHTRTTSMLIPWTSGFPILWGFNMTFKRDTMPGVLVCSNHNNCANMKFHVQHGTLDFMAHKPYCLDSWSAKTTFAGEVFFYCLQKCFWPPYGRQTETRSSNEAWVCGCMSHLR